MVENTGDTWPEHSTFTPPRGNGTELVHERRRHPAGRAMAALCSRGIGLAAIFLIVVLTFGAQRYNQLAIAAGRAQERLLAAQFALDRERSARSESESALRVERAERARDRELCAAALPSREAVREAVRQLLSEAARDAASSSPMRFLKEGGSRASVTLLAQAELVRT